MQNIDARGQELADLAPSATRKASAPEMRSSAAPRGLRWPFDEPCGKGIGGKYCWW